MHRFALAPATSTSEGAGFTLDPREPGVVGGGGGGIGAGVVAVVGVLAFLLLSGCSSRAQPPSAPAGPTGADSDVAAAPLPGAPGAPTGADYDLAAAAPLPGAPGALQSAPGAPTVADSDAFYAAQPRHLRPVPHSAVPEGLPDLRSATCGACHAAIYAEWQVSTHARALFDDAQFMAELHKSEAQGVDWMCLNCHTPVPAQLKEVVVALRDGAKDRPVRIPNPRFDAALQADAIGCATCHVRDGVVLGPFGDTAAPHATRRDAGLLDVGVCTQCHQASAHFREINLLCAFETGAEYAAGPYDERGETCQSCHMPAVERPLVAGMPARATRRHWFGGSLLPKAPAFAAEVAAMAEHYEHGLTLEWEGLPERLTPGPQRLTARYRNARAGHRLPTGDPERWILVRATAEDADGRVLATAEERIGTVFRWWPDIERLSDNRLAPLEARALTLEFEAKGPVTLRLFAEKGRLSDEVMAFHKLEGKAVPKATFVDEARTVGVR